MLASLAHLALPHLEWDIPGHTGPKPLEFRTPSHPSSSCMGLLMDIPDQLFPQNRRQTTLSRSLRLVPAANVSVSSPSL